MYYDAFISYSHAADGMLAPRLQSALLRIAKPWYKPRLLNVYRDTTNLALNPSLWESIERAINESKFFIFLGSPKAAASRWVRQEIAYWLHAKDPQRLLIVLTDGILEWDSETDDFDWNRTTALPRELSGVFAGEPLWLDLRWAKHGNQVSRHDLRFQDGIATIAAALLGKSKNELIGEEVRLRRLKMFTVAGVICVLCVLVGVSFWQWSNASRRAIEALSLAQASKAVYALKDGKPDRAVELALQANDIDDPLPQAVQALADVAYNVAGTRHTFSGHTGKVSRARLVPGGRYAVTGSDDATVRLWDIQNGKHVRTYSGHHAKVTDVAVSSDGKRILSAAADGRFCLLEIDNDLSPKCFDGHGDTITRVAFIPNSDLAIYGTKNGGLIVWDLELGTVNHQLPGHTGAVLSLAVDPVGGLAASGAADELVCIWDLNSGAQRCCLEPQTIIGPTYGPTDIAFHPDGDSVLVGFGGHPNGVSVALIETESCTMRGKFRGHEGGATVVAIGPDGHLALSGSLDADLVLWDLTGRRELDRYRSHLSAITSVDFSADGRGVLSGSADQTARLWDITSGAEENRFLASTRGWLSVSDNGRYAVSLGSRYRSLHLWELAGSQLELDSVQTSSHIITAAVSNSGDRVLIGANDGSVWMWLLSTGEPHKFTDGHHARVTRVLFGPEEKKALSSSYPQQNFDRMLILWDLDTGQMIRRFVGHQEVIRDVAFSSDGRSVISGSADGTIRMWDVASGEERLRFKGHNGGVFSVAINNDGSRIASGSRDLSVRIWDVGTGKEQMRLEGHTGSVMSVAFGPKGDRLLSGSDDGTVRLWNIYTGEQVGRFEGHTAGVRYVAFRQEPNAGLSYSRDTDILKDNTLRWWRLEPPKRLIEWVCENRFVGDFQCPESNRRIQVP
jgi:WD40 repeat protein